jgi:hypothetical protein
MWGLLKKYVMEKALTTELDLFFNDTYEYVTVNTGAYKFST